ncbi:ribosomal protein L4 [Actinidia rufa]|uniref:Large ribosomal subunit protein uL4c n=1 Tax=Actinidia rufa TaxID=165716 RepID=A0A7J0DNT8_9ERIC|nr:ribosomal protein L4 [Actinidia rufa]
MAISSPPPSISFLSSSTFLKPPLRRPPAQSSTAASSPTSVTSGAAPPPPSPAARSAEAASSLTRRRRPAAHAVAPSARTPLRPGGGVIFGPKPKDWSIKINRKEKRLAISTAISSAAENIVVVEEFGDRFERPRTKDFIELMRKWGIDPKEKSMFLLTEVSDNVVLSSRNIGTLKMLTPRTLNLFDILNSDKLVFTQSAVDYLNETYGVDYEGEFEDDEEEFEEDGEEGEG